MDGSIKMTGFGRVEAMFKNLAIKVPDTARSQMKRSAKKVVDLAQIFVPEETGALRDSIRIERTYGVRGRLEISIVVGGLVVQRDNRIVNLDQYALQVHENYDDVNPGPRTIEKQARYPGYQIGSQFLFRALKAVEEPLMRAMTVAIEKIIQQEDGQ